MGRIISDSTEKAIVKRYRKLLQLRNVSVLQKNVPWYVYVVDEVRQFETNPRLEHVKIIARRIVSSYPETFQDRTDEGECLGSGSYSLAMKLKTRIDHVNRNNSVVKIRQVPRRLHSRPDAANDSASTDEPRKCQPSDRYGCIVWQPEELPRGGTYDALDDYKTQLMNISARDGPSTCSVGEVDELMKVIFVLQRRSINADPPTPLSASSKKLRQVSRLLPADVWVVNKWIESSRCLLSVLLLMMLSLF